MSANIVAWEVYSIILDQDVKPEDIIPLVSRGRDREVQESVIYFPGNTVYCSLLEMNYMAPKKSEQKLIELWFYIAPAMWSPDY